MDAILKIQNKKSKAHTRKRKSFAIFVFVFFIFNCLSLIFAVTPAHAGAAEDILQGLRQTAEKGGLKPVGREPAIGGVAAFSGQLVGYLLAFVGVIFFALMLYGGILWMTARGAEEQIKKAQELIKSAVTGLIIVFGSYVIVRFVLTQLTASIQ